jgi:Domain of unknown function (DUF4159)/Aerotolerance regulator N-terminal
MSSLFSLLQFGTPLALFGLISLPVIWWLLRFTPPKPKQIKFPPIRILLGLPTQEETPDKTPWWLLLLRLGLAALLIFAVSQPFLQPKSTDVLPLGHRLIVVDDGWASAQTWNVKRDFILQILEQARSEGLTVTLTGTAPVAGALANTKQPAREALERARLMKPSALDTDRLAFAEKLKTTDLKDIASIIWLSDGTDSKSSEAFGKALSAIAPLRIYAPSANDLPMALGPLVFDGNDIKISAVRNAASLNTATVKAIATNGRTLTELPVEFGTATEKQVSLNLPNALRNEIAAIAIDGQDHAGARQLFDDRWRRRAIALQSGQGNVAGQLLLAPLHYVKRGLEPYAELSEPQSDAELSALVDAGLSMLVLADVGAISDEQTQKLNPWIERGGVLLRFAGPRLATAADTLLPVALRQGDRSLGSSLSWEVPQGLAAFPDTSPFSGLAIDTNIKVQKQVLAEPSPELPDRTWASLEDGTPLVTAEKRGKGLVVLFHVTANADWSNLPLSGLFLNMLQRVEGLDAASTQTIAQSAEANFVPRLMLSGEGVLVAPEGSIQPITAKAMETAKASLATPPGIYTRQGRERAINHALDAATLNAMPTTLNGTAVQPYTEAPRQDLAPIIFAAAALFFLLDTLATIWLGGGLKRAATVAAVMLALALAPPPEAEAQTKTEAPPNNATEMDIKAALETSLAYVITGDTELDETSKAGLRGLTLLLSDRTSTALAEPVGLDLTQDELVFYPVIYWPVPENVEPLSDAVRTKISTYMKNGGSIFFDTRDGGLDASLSGGGNASLQTLLAKLDLPPLEPVPEKHVLTRSFYLLDRFPGRYDGPAPWVEAQATGDVAATGAADGVSSIIIGANDYAAAWAINDNGDPLNALVGNADRQREFAFRTGINIVMYALTGNYKADQVHVPALLERLGQ